MLFKPELAEKIIRGTKTQTRRAVKAGKDTFTKNGARYDMDLDWCYVERNGRLLWSRGRDYAVCPGRGKPTIKYAWLSADELAYWHPHNPLPSVQEWIPARIRITAIRQECVGDITEADAIAEGFDNRDEFLRVFKQINPKSDLFTQVWVLTFCLVNR